MPNSSILRVYSEMDFIQVNPEYQRKGEVWNLEKKQLLIDSILNEYDIPKLYFHYLKSGLSLDSARYTYSIVDGRQRFETICDFIDGKFKLSDDFKYLHDPTIQAQSMTYADLAEKYPKLKIRFDAFSLPVILIESDDLELIEDLFSRLNEAVPLNSAEKRNAIGGSMASLIREMANQPFFTKKVRISNKRFQHQEIICRLLFLEYNLKQSEKILDTKKPYLDAFVKMYKDNNERIPIHVIKKEARSILTYLEKVFIDSDPLLKAQANIPIYYLVAREIIKPDSNDNQYRITRKSLEQFHHEILENRSKYGDSITEINFDLYEYDRLSQQGTNDASSIRERVNILVDYLTQDQHQS